MTEGELKRAIDHRYLRQKHPMHVTQDERGVMFVTAIGTDKRRQVSTDQGDMIQAMNATYENILAELVSEQHAAEQSNAQ